MMLMVIMILRVQSLQSCAQRFWGCFVGSRSLLHELPIRSWRVCFLNAKPATYHSLEPSNPTRCLREGPLIELHPKIGWETFSLYAILPAAIFVSYRYVLSEARLFKALL